MDSSLKNPIGCFRWTIVLCSFTNHMISTGMLLSLSVVYVSWLETFQESKFLTSLILSLACALQQGFSPVAASLAARFGFRAVAVAGAILMCVGLVVSAFATSVVYLIASIGLVSGIGANFCYLPSLAVIALYFDTRRALAMGIAVTGFGVGTFLFAPLINYLVETYSWRGALLLLGAISLHMCATGLLFRPIYSSETVAVGEDDHEEKMMKTLRGTGEEEEDEEEEEEKLYEEREEHNKLPQCVVTTADSDVHATGIKNMVHEVDFGDDTKYHHKGIEQRSLLRLISPDLKRILREDPSTGHKRQDHNVNMSLNELRPKTEAIPSSSFPNLKMDQQEKRSHSSLIRSLRNIDLALLASARSFHRLSEEPYKETEHVCDSPQSDCETKEKNSNRRNQQHWGSRCMSSAFVKTNLDTLRDKAFLIFCFSNFLVCLSYYTPVMYLVDRAVSQGIDKPLAAILISINGIGNVLARFTTGALADGCGLNRLLAFIVTLCTQGIGTMLSCLCGEVFILHAAYAFFLGFHMGIYATLAPLVTVDLRGASNMATAYGIVLAFDGVASFLGPPISGWLFDLSRNYVLTYLIIGVFLVVGGVMLLPLLSRRCRKRLSDHQS